MNHKIADGWAALALIAAAACWGGATVLSKSILQTLPPITLLVLQLSASSFLLWVLVTMNRAWPTQRTGLLPLALMGLLNPGISYTLSLIGLTMTTASVSTLLWATEPVMILASAWLLLGERLTSRLLGFSLVALLGALLVGGFTEATAVEGTLYGNTLCFLAVLCCAPYTVVARRFGASFDPFFVLALQQSVALVWALAIWPFEHQATGGAALRSLPMAVWLGAGGSGIVYYALAYWLYLRGLAGVSATVAGASLNLIPLFGVGGAYLFLHERLTVAQWLGAGAILLAVYAIFFLPGNDAKPTADRADVFPA